MGVIRKEGIQSSIITYLGVLLGAFNTLWVYPKYLEASEIGLITLLINVALIIAPIAQMGSNGIIFKFYPEVKDDEKKLKSFFFLISFIPLIGFLFSMFLLFICRDLLVNVFAENSPLFVDFLFVLVPLSFILVGRNIVDNLSRIYLKVSYPKFLKEVLLRVLFFLVAVTYFYYNFSLSYFIWSTVAAFGLNLLLAVLYLKKLGNFKVTASLKPLDKKFLRACFIYGVFNILSGFAGIVVTKIDSWMIASYLGLEDTGVFSIALYIGLALSIPKRSIELITLPIVGRHMSEGNMAEVKSLYQKTSLSQLILGSIMFICLWLNIDDVFSLIPNSEVYIEGKYVVLFISLAVFIDIITGVNHEIIAMSSFFKWNFWITGFLIGISILNNHFLIPIYGITGAAMATAFAMFLHNLVKSIIIYYKLKIQPFTINTLKSMIISIIIFVIGYVLPTYEIAIVNIAYKSTILITLFAVSHYYMKVSSDFNTLALDVIKKILRGIKN